MMDSQLTSSHIPSLPDELNSPQAKLVYLYLEATGSATVTDVSETLAMKKIATLSVLDSLLTYGLIEKSDDRYVTTT